MRFQERQALLVRRLTRIHQLLPPDVANRHPGGSKLREERDPLEVRRPVAAMAAPVAAHGLEQPRALVVAKCVRSAQRLEPLRRC